MTDPSPPQSPTPARRRSPAKGARPTTQAKAAAPKPTAEAPGQAKTRAQARPGPARGAFAAGAARASGERQRRAGTPLISTSDPVEVSQARRAMARTSPPATATAPAAPPAPQSESPKPTSAVPPASSASPRPPEGARRRPTRAAVTAAARRTARPDRSTPPRLRTVRSGEQAPHATAPTPVPLPTPAAPRASGSAGAAASADSASSAGSAASAGGSAGSWTEAIPRPSRLVGAVLEATEFTSHVGSDPSELVQLAVNVLRAAATAAGLPTEEAERQVAHGLAYVRRRLSGSYEVDEFGFDEDFTNHVYLPLLRPLYNRWFRVEVRGIENIPATGGALVVANHSGTVALDSVMTQVAVHDEHPQQRHLRMLGADLVFSTPFVGTMARRSGSTLAANTDAERLLRRGELVGVWPEGFKGVGKPFTERYKLQRFGRGGFVSAALRTGVPIIPCSIVGAEEIYPIIGNMPTVARLLGVPYAPITPTFPLLGPLGLIPLPSKWLIEFGPPIDTASFGEDAAEDPMLVFDLTDQVRETIQQTLYSLLMQRKSVFL